MSLGTRLFLPFSSPEPIVLISALCRRKLKLVAFVVVELLKDSTVSKKMAEKWRVMITGASGLLGRAVFKKLSKDESFLIMGCAHSRCRGNLRQIDLMDLETTEKVVREFQPNVLIHSAGERRPDVVEKNEGKAKQINVDSTARLAQIMTSLNEDLKQPRHFMLYISTDYVFDGTSPPYTPRDQPNPLNKYGKSKLEGEKMLLAYHPIGGILRIPILYGEVEYLRESAVTCESLFPCSACLHSNAAISVTPRWAGGGDLTF